MGKQAKGAGHPGLGLCSRPRDLFDTWMASPSLGSTLPLHLPVQRRDLSLQPTLSRRGLASDLGLLTLGTAITPDFTDHYSVTYNIAENTNGSLILSEK